MLARALQPVASSGWCSTCSRVHKLTRTAEAEAEALALIDAIDMAGTFDLAPPVGDPRFATSSMHRAGKMLGVLTTTKGITLRAFSGMLGSPSTWHCSGWSGPVASITLEDCKDAAQRFATIVQHVERAATTEDAAERARQKRLHRDLSLLLSADMQASVVLQNARGQSISLPEHLNALNGGYTQLPGGVGDCAAPKLLTEAYQRGLRPTGLAEVWYVPPGRRGSSAPMRASSGLSRSKLRRTEGTMPKTGGARTLLEHRSFHPACKERCEPIMGFMLCGLDDA
mmetsp:Transcript_10723/g.27528  ORF Transcript_10723/g.27528 Transcript_10723/m.27528 type:complete len:284 (-) Transcript_10723:53-904(-)